jgi:hypothetical protein
VVEKRHSYGVPWPAHIGYRALSPLVRARRPTTSHKAILVLWNRLGTPRLALYFLIASNHFRRGCCQFLDFLKCRRVGQGLAAAHGGEARNATIGTDGFLDIVWIERQRLHLNEARALRRTAAKDLGLFTPARAAKHAELAGFALAGIRHHANPKRFDHGSAAVLIDAA